jgi:prepilin-type N-terminal cleavage/methylation domain-containing protein
MKQRYQASLRQRGFSLLELLAVITIMAILASLAVLSFRGMNSSGNFNKAVDEISGILEQGRSYAMGQNTYVWIVLYENAPANSPTSVFVAAFASGDGTDPFGWSSTPATVTVPPGTVNGTTLTQIIRVHRYKGLNLETTTLPSAPSNSATPATNPATPPATAAPVFQLTTQSDAGQIQLANAGTGAISTYWLIQFTPTGAARTSANPIDSVWLGMQPSLSATGVDTHNIASIKVSGLTGAVAVYRE